MSNMDAAKAMTIKLDAVLPEYPGFACVAVSSMSLMVRGLWYVAVNFTALWLTLKLQIGERNSFPQLVSRNCTL